MIVCVKTKLSESMNKNKSGFQLLTIFISNSNSMLKNFTVMQIQNLISDIYNSKCSKTRHPLT